MIEKRKNMGKFKKDAIIPIAPPLSEMNSSYIYFINDLLESIKKERVKIVFAANKEMIILYWNIGKKILDKQVSEGWGTKVIDRLSKGLNDAFPEMRGFSPRNLKYMRKFAECWPDFEFVQRFVAQIPWRSNIILLDKLKDQNSRIWYADKLICNGWSKDILELQISTMLIKRQGNATNNFTVTLPSSEFDMAKHIFKDPYLFDFLGTDELRREAELEDKLTHHIEKFLVELGQRKMGQHQSNKLVRRDINE